MHCGDNRDYKKEYEEFWKDIVENDDGTLNKDQVMRELSDYSMVMDNCARAYCLMTHQRISKQNTMFFEVENIFNDLFIDKELCADDLINTVITKDMSHDEIIKAIREYLGYYE
ncbi:MAG: hypothetical protein J6K18_06160 [Bacilli bacterium]|nr:hypothetical protein [Bacilli bacterium]